MTERTPDTKKAKEAVIEAAEAVGKDVWPRVPSSSGVPNSPGVDIGEDEWPKIPGASVAQSQFEKVPTQSAGNTNIDHLEFDIDRANIESSAFEGPLQDSASSLASLRSSKDLIERLLS